MKRGIDTTMHLVIVSLMLLGLIGCKKSNEAPQPHQKKSAAAEAAQPNEAASKPVPTSFTEKPAVGTVAKCAVSGETFTVDEDTVVAERDGRFYPFCCASCEGELEVDPAEAAGS